MNKPHSLKNNDNKAAKEQKYRVLFVDDEPRVTSALKAMFRREYEVSIANSGAEALDLMRQSAFDVLVSDQRMPGMLGNELLAEVAKRHPQTMSILLTGFMDKKAIVDSINDGEVYRFINKPWRNDEMREVVAEAALASQCPTMPNSIDDLANLGLATPESSQPAALRGQATPEENSVNSEPHQNALLMMEKAQDTRNQIRRFCSDESIMIYSTQNIEQAVSAVTSRKNIGVAIIELSSNTQNAIQTINLLKLARPEIVTIALTQEYDAHTAVDLINQGQVFKYLAKPINLETFQKALGNAFFRHQFLKRHTEAQQRFKVEKVTGTLMTGLHDMFSGLIGGRKRSVT